MNKIRMIGLDLDGTLLNEKKELTDYTKRVLEEAIEQETVVVVATGRPVTGVPKMLLEFPGMRYVLSSNGGRITDLKENRHLYECPVPYETAVKILKVFGDYDALKEIYFDGKGYVQKDEVAHVERYLTNPAMAEYIRTTREVLPNLWDKMQELEGHGVDKVHALFADLNEREEALERLRKIGELEITSALSRNLEVNAPGVDKGRGLLKLGQMLGIQREEIMACGDGGNDLAMIRAAGLGVAMANASETVKEAADYITLSNDEDGVARAIEKFVLHR